MKFFSFRCKFCKKNVKYLVNHIFKKHFEETQYLRYHKDGYLNSIENDCYEDPKNETSCSFWI